MKTAREYFKEEWGTGFTKATLSEKGAVVEMSMEDIYNTMESFASQPKWISVEDALPPLNQKVLGATENGYIDLGYWNEEVGDIESGTSFFIHASYWQPLPTPPTK
jgi:hypothetical protein